MQTTARQLVEYVRTSIRALSLDPAYGTLDAVYVDLAARSGLSKSMVMKLYSGASANPTADALDRLVGAVRQAMCKTAA